MSSQRKETSAKRLIRGVRNGANKRVFGQNIERRFQKLLGHSLTSKAFLHGEYPCLMHFIGGQRERNAPN
jgi:hypothetical protein